MTSQLNQDNLPEHIAIIMDGNGRWAKAKNRPRLFGHNAGMKTLKKIVRASSDAGIKILTVYAFSTENWKRSKEEVDGLMNIAIEYFKKEISLGRKPKFDILDFNYATSKTFEFVR